MTTLQNDRSTIATTGGASRIPPAVFALAAGVVAVGTSEFLVAGLLPQIASDTAVSIPQAGALISAFAIGMVLGAPIMAVATLRLPRKATLFAMLGVFVAAHALSLVVTSFTMLVILRVIAAAATGGYWAVAAVTAVKASPVEVRARALAMLVGGLTIANVAGVPLGTLLGQHLGWRSAFLAVGLLALAAAVALALWVPRASTAEASEPIPEVRSELVAFRRGRLWLALGATAAFQLAVMAIFSYISPILTELTGVRESVVPVFLALFGVGSLGGVWLGGRLADRYPWRTLLGALSGLAVVLVATFLVVRSTPLMYVAVFAFGVTAFTAAAPLNARVFSLAGSAPTLASSVNVSAFNVGNTLGPALGGWAIGAGLGFRIPIVIGVVSVAVSAALTLRGRALDSVDARAVHGPDLISPNDAYAYPAAPSESKECVEATC
ncbi:DHA1 family chloramphenicol resistance protein-like MFS transporter [Antricoccus suffuscus]|uniref:DHA1 family chloramphenicol resistance protein-like MFS transporter n=1 Tax=Antricoccus suffuscus TaxID=1629062 RepID=A0A2T0ZXI3_9ACTN|nr:MFS transporter [Antricoccus suffuscus]PRZ40788.1 DHA1 family chloramphenicol resistance protein-like MFS transporter [Antricoccus suffuscus]